MPKLKVDHVVSFSSEDHVHVVNNILLPDSSKKWKCQTAGEKSATVILQLEKASVISSIDIGNEHSAYVEVLVSRSSNVGDFKVLLVMSSFMTPIESRQSTNLNKVRMFRYDELQSAERDQKWDRIKIVCTQPFNRHVQYGLSFITLYTPETKDGATTTPGPLKLGNFSLRPNSPDNLSVGSLFARRKELASDSPLTAAAAIREATSTQRLRSPQCKPRLKDSTSTTPSKKDALNINNSNSDTPKARNRNEILYSKDEEEPNEKIDKLIDQKIKEAKEKRAREEEDKMKDKKKKQSDKKESKEDKNAEEKNSKPTANAASSSRADTSKRKLNGKETPHKKIKIDKLTKPFNQLLNGVTIVISGIQNPERATIRSEALAMGAKYKADWDHTSTHLICAFTNTPKFNQVKGKGKIVNRLWITDCHSQRKRLPWRRYALDNKDQGKAESEDEICEQRSESPDIQIVEDSPKTSEDDDGTDTEDEIDRVKALQVAKNKLSDSIYCVDTDEENFQQQPKHDLPKLPDFLSNKVLYIDTELSDNNKTLLLRYITAYNGILVDEPSDVVDVAISSPQSCDSLKILCTEAQVVSPSWIWECHNAKRLISFDNYRL